MCMFLSIVLVAFLATNKYLVESSIGRKEDSPSGYCLRGCSSSGCGSLLSAELQISMSHLRNMTCLFSTARSVKKVSILLRYGFLFLQDDLKHLIFVLGYYALTFFFKFILLRVY